jgi:hypothetical protein
VGTPTDDERLNAPGKTAGEKRPGGAGENRDIPGDMLALELEEDE